MTREEYNKMVDLADNVYRFVLSNVGDSDIAQDIVQDSYAQLWLHRDEVENGKSYLFTTAYNRLIDIERKAKFSSQEEIVGTAIEPSYETSNSDLREVIEKALAKLSSSHRQLILLRDYEGYSYDEIAKITNLSATQVKVYIFRARKEMKEIILHLI